MDALNEVGGDIGKKTFFTHVFDMSKEANGEIMNVTQYALLGIIPVLFLNKLIQRFSPEADPESSSVELLAEIILQVVVMFVGIVLIHRIITYVPTYSGFRYEHLTLTNVILAFLMIVLSLQTKLGIKVNILYDRLIDLWNGSSSNEKKSNVKSRVRVNESMISSPAHNESQADYLDAGSSSMFPPAPVVQSKPRSSYDDMMRGSAQPHATPGPTPANAILGGAFGCYLVAQINVI
jgi:hypothetical protein